MSRSRPCEVSVSVSSRGKNQTSWSHLGLVELQEGLGLGLVSDQKPNVSVSCPSCKLRSHLYLCPCVIGQAIIFLSCGFFFYRSIYLSICLLFFLA